jgi:tRNA-uridine 2-sulfurtransferase
MTKKRVLVGMSGGVDSSVAAALLLEQGYDVVGITLKLYDFTELNFEPPDGGCCTIELINDARSVCNKLSVPHYVIDLRESFEKNVIDNFIESYTRGRTPNPCINCNRFIKWGSMLVTADKLGCDYISTGHYARIERSDSTVRLLTSVDPAKDQSYALWGIKPEALRRTLLPIGDHTKVQIREIARKYGFRNADRPDSQEICFVPDGDYAAIVRQRREDDDSLKAGPILDVKGSNIGEHKGYAYFTIGQRKGFGISSPSPLYVIHIDPANRSITVGTKEYLLARAFSAREINMLVPDYEIPLNIIAKIRYKHTGSPAHLSIDGDIASVIFDEPERAITPGQSVVFYSGDQVIGGGIIDKVQ